MTERVRVIAGDLAAIAVGVGVAYSVAWILALRGVVKKVTR